MRLRAAIAAAGRARCHAEPPQAAALAAGRRAARSWSAAAAPPTPTAAPGRQPSRPAMRATAMAPPLTARHARERPGGAERRDRQRGHRLEQLRRHGPLPFERREEHADRHHDDEHHEHEQARQLARPALAQEQRRQRPAHPRQQRARQDAEDRAHDPDGDRHAVVGPHDRRAHRHARSDEDRRAG